MAPNKSVVFKSAGIKKLRSVIVPRLNSLARRILSKPTVTWYPAAAAEYPAAAAAAAASRKKSHKALLTLFSFLKRTLSSTSKITCRNLISTRWTEPIDHPSPPINISHPRLCRHFGPQKIHPLNSSRSSNPESDTSAFSKLSYSKLRNRSGLPCTARPCTETLSNSSLMEKHKSVKHAVSVLASIDEGTIAKIFEDEWTDTSKKPKIHRILEINHSADMLMRFDNYLHSVKNRARSDGALLCAVTGNEQRLFYGSPFICDLGLNGNTTICGQEYCGVCRIIKSGFGTTDGISMLRRSSRAHVHLPKKLLKDEKRAVMICRVVAGRDHLDSFAQGGDECDSSGAVNPRESEELLVYKPEAVLPTHVVVYTI